MNLVESSAGLAYEHLTAICTDLPTELHLLDLRFSIKKGRSFKLSSLFFHIVLMFQNIVALNQRKEVIFSDFLISTFFEV